MKQLLIFSFLIISIDSTFAQDTVYLDKKRQITARESAEFIRITTEDADTYRCVVSYANTGSPYSITSYKDKELTTLEGKAEFFYADGTPDSEGGYKNNKREGTWTFYFPTGKVSGRVFFRNGRVATSEYLERYGHMMDDNEDAFPSFKGGKEALILYIRKTFKPLQSTAGGKEKIKGIMKVGFVVSETGKVTNAHIVSGINDEINQKAIELINSMPDWYPGRQLDTPVRVPLVIPIIF